MSNAPTQLRSIEFPTAIQPARDWLGGAGLGLCAVSCATSRGLGVAVGLAVFLIGIPTTPLVAFAVGQLGLIVAHPGGGLAFWGGQLGLFFVLTEPIRAIPNVDRGWQAGITAVTAGAYTVLAAAIWGLLSVGIGLAAVGLSGLVGGSLYIIHRYGLVRLGVVSDSESDASPTPE